MAAGVRTPGVFNIPVCGMAEARANWLAATDGKEPWVNFPCNP